MVVGVEILRLVLDVEPLPDEGLGPGDLALLVALLPHHRLMARRRRTSPQKKNPTGLRPRRRLSLYKEGAGGRARKPQISDQFGSAQKWNPGFLAGDPPQILEAKWAPRRGNGAANLAGDHTPPNRTGEARGRLREVAAGNAAATKERVPRHDLVGQRGEHHAGAWS